MKIAKGHYVPKELITSEAVHEAVVKCFVAAGFNIKTHFGRYENPHDDGLCVSTLTGNIIWGVVGETCDTPLTLQQLFTAENGLQWPDWAESICTNGESVYFCNDVKFSFIVGSSFGGDVDLLATRQANASSQADSLTHSEEGLTHGDWFDYEMHKAVNPAPVGTKLIVDCFDKGWKDAVVIGSFERWNWIDIAGVGLETVDLCRIKPLDHATRKAELERKALIEQAYAIHYKCADYEDFCEKLIDVGWRPTK